MSNGTTLAPAPARWAVFAFFLSLFVLAVAAAVFFAVWQPGPAGGMTACGSGKPPAQTAAPSAPAAPVAPITLSRAATGPATIAFLQRRAADTLDVPLDASDAVPADERAQVDARLVTALVRPDNASRFPLSQTHVTQEWSPNGRHLVLHVCLDPNQRVDVQPGRYDGTVRVEGGRVQQFDVPVEATLREEHWWVVVLWAVAAALAGAYVKLLTDVAKLQAPPPGTTATVAQGTTPPNLWQALVLQGTELPFLLTVVVGLAAAFGAFFVLYLNNDTFGTSSNDWFKLVVWCFGATVSGMTVADLGKHVPTYAKG